MKKLLNNLGLDDKEAQVYQALLELGPATVTRVTRKAGITRTLGYQILEKLSIFGLVNQVSGEDAKIRYAAEHPRRLIQHLKNKRNTWDRRVEKAEERLPELVSLYRVADKPTIRYQEGVSGVKAIFDETLKSKETILSILDIEGWDNVAELRKYQKWYNRERSDLKVRIQFLMLDTPQGRAWMKDYKGSHQYSTYRWIKPEQLPGISEFGGEINIYEDKVVMALLKRPNMMGVLMESSALANILKGLFHLAWEQGVESRPRRKKS